ncbi:MAG: DUF1353 domain-containing protein [Pseudomonadota bacterium]
MGDVVTTGGRFPKTEPTIPNPYPDAGWGEIAAFRYLDDLHLCRAVEAIRRAGGRDSEYIVAQSYSCAYTLDGEEKTLTVPAGMLTDLTSVPSLGRVVVGRVGKHLEAAILHDFLFIAWQFVEGRGARFSDFRFSNALMLAATETAKVSWLTRQSIDLAISSWVGRQVYDENDRANGATLFVTLP